jgi:chromosome partitioning protein
MIIAIADQCGTCGRAIAESLALLRARSGRKVLVIDAEPPHQSAAPDRSRVRRCSITGRSLSAELEHLIPRYQDIVIDTDRRDTAGRAALIAARLAIVPIQPGQADLDCHYPLIARLNAARMFNPGLRVMFVVAAGPVEPSSVDMARIRAYVAQVMAATLCATIIPEQGAAFAATSGEIAALYHDVFPV